MRESMNFTAQKLGSLALAMIKVIFLNFEVVLQVLFSA